MKGELKKVNEFIRERDKRLKIIADKSLWTELQQMVKINNKPISYATARSTFNAKTFEELKGPKLRVWLKSEDIIRTYESEVEKYGAN